MTKHIIDPVELTEIKVGDTIVIGNKEYIAYSESTSLCQGCCFAGDGGCINNHPLLKRCTVLFKEVGAKTYEIVVELNARFTKIISSNTLEDACDIAKDRIGEDYAGSLEVISHREIK